MPVHHVGILCMKKIFFNLFLIELASWSNLNCRVLPQINRISISFTCYSSALMSLSFSRTQSLIKSLNSLACSAKGLCNVESSCTAPSAWPSQPVRHWRRSNRYVTDGPSLSTIWISKNKGWRCREILLPEWNGASKPSPPVQRFYSEVPSPLCNAFKADSEPYWCTRGLRHPNSAWLNHIQGGDSG